MSSNVWKIGLWFAVALATAFCLIAVQFYDGLSNMIASWDTDEYSHSYLLPLIAVYFIWQKKNELAVIEFNGSWVGVAIFCLGLLGYLVGELSTLYPVIQYSFLISLGGLLLALMGWAAFRVIFVPLCILFFVVPLPNFLYNNLSSFLQLISSKLGVEVIRMFGISVFLEGNVIDLGKFKLQVVEACSGLRYLFPLMSLGFIAAYLFKAAFWKKAVVFLSSIPITVLMNSFRIGVIGVMTEYWGQEMAEGFLHDFEGWVVFMACMAVLIAEMWLLSRIGADSVPFSDVFAVDPPAAIPETTNIKERVLPHAFYVSFALLIAIFFVSQTLPERSEIIPERIAFKTFPIEIGGYQGSPNEMEAVYLEELKLSDYILSDYVDKAGQKVNFYVAYYDSQRKGVSVHSPKSCLPGGGWRMQELDQITIAGSRIEANRAVIQMGDVKQVVYYWFQQRGRVVTNEYLVKWYLFWDALTKQRTDGALVRLTTIVPYGNDIRESDALLQDFANKVSKELEKYLPK